MFLSLKVGLPVCLVGYATGARAHVANSRHAAHSRACLLRLYERVTLEVPVLSYPSVAIIW